MDQSNKKNLILGLGIFLILLLTLSIIVYQVQKPQEIRTRAQTTEAWTPKLAVVDEALKNRNVKGDVYEAEKWTLSLYQLISQYQKEDSARKREMIPHMRKVAEQRKEQLLILAGESPKEFLRLTIPEDLRRQTPEEIKGGLEKWTTKEGVVASYVVEDFEEGGQDFHIQALVTAQDTFILSSPDDKYDVFKGLLSGTKIEVSGFSLGSKMVVSDPEVHLKILEKPVLKSSWHKRLSAQAYAAADTPIGDWPVAVILVNFLDDKTQPFSKADADTFFFSGSTSANQLFKESSYNQFSISGKVLGWYTLPLKKADYPSNITIFNEAIKAADTDVFFPSFSSVAVVKNSFHGGGFGTQGQTTFLTSDGSVVAGQVWLDTVTANKKKVVLRDLIVHELGHNLGLGHENAWECGTKVIDIDPNTKCKKIFQGGLASTMALRNGHYNALHKEHLGWIPANHAQEVTVSGIYTLEPTAVNTGKIKALKIPKSLPTDPKTPYYFIEYRQPIGADKAIYPFNFNGAYVHYNLAGSRLPLNKEMWALDMTPASGTYSDWNDPTLEVGKKYTDPDSGISFSTLSATSAELKMNVTLPPPACIHKNPTVAIFPPISQSGAPGTPLAYTFEVWNNDNSVCAPATFSLNSNVSSLYPGWAASFSASSVTVAPGTRSTQTITVTSSPTAISALYDFHITATNSADSTFTHSSDAQYVVISSNNPPSVYAGQDRLITLPASFVSIMDSFVSDEDMAAVIVSWNKVSGPTGATIISPNSINTDINGLNIAGTYVFRLAATDNASQTGFDDVAITVNPSNFPPTVSASASPGSGPAPLTVSFNAVASDPDGTIVSYSWTFGDGGTSSAQNPNHIYSAAGTYTAIVTVTDNEGATASNTVVLTVNPAVLEEITLQVTEGYDQKNNKTLAEDGKLSYVQVNDSNRVETLSSYFNSFEFGNFNFPAGVSIKAVKIYVVHYEEKDFRSGKLQWDAGNGTLRNPTTLTTKYPAILQEESKEGTDIFDVSNIINTPSKVNDLIVTVRNNDTLGNKKTFTDHIYVKVQYYRYSPPKTNWRLL